MELGLPKEEAKEEPYFESLMSDTLRERPEVIEDINGSLFSSWHGWVFPRYKRDEKGELLIPYQLIESK